MAICIWQDACLASGRPKLTHMNENPALIVRAFRILKFERHNFSRRVDAVGNCVHSKTITRKNTENLLTKKTNLIAFPKVPRLDLSNFDMLLFFAEETFQKFTLPCAPSPYRKHCMCNFLPVLLKHST